jgi:hypothetical protein
VQVPFNRDSRPSISMAKQARAHGKTVQQHRASSAAPSLQLCFVPVRCGLQHFRQCAVGIDDEIILLPFTCMSRFFFDLSHDAPLSSRSGLLQGPAYVDRNHFPAVRCGSEVIDRLDLVARAVTVR